jgi:threonyl-tRNA synthetase
MENRDNLYAMRHSLAHIMAAALKRARPNIKLGVGPVVEHGFYYDIDLGEERISEEDFEGLEIEMRKIISENQPFVHSTKLIDEAIAWAKEGTQPYKEELLNDLKRAGTTVAKDLSAEELGTISEGESSVSEVSFYTNGDFTDLCRGPHVESTGKVGAFKILRVAGAYWRGQEDKPQMQRVYGVAFATQAELDKHLNMLESALRPGIGSIYLLGSGRSGVTALDTSGHHYAYGAGQICPRDARSSRLPTSHYPSHHQKRPL